MGPSAAEQHRPRGRISRLAGQVTGRVIETIGPDSVID